MNYRAITDQMLEDAAEVAFEVCLDLGFRSCRITLDRSLYLCERHGNALPVFCRLPPNYRGRCYYSEGLDGRIEVSRYLRGKQKTLTILHELTHRVCMCSERFEHLNRERYTTYDFKDFHELIAMIVTEVSDILIKQQHKDKVN